MRDGIAAFSTPTVVHFCAALLIGAAITAPSPMLACVGGLLTVAALVALAYSIRIIARARAVDEYEPDFEDRLSYMILPVVAYSVMLLAAVVLPFRPTTALFGLAGTSVLLIFLGIHNAWDVVTYVGVQRLAAEQAEDKATGAAPPPSQTTV
jgi:NADH:ubiquinone oxidoreductase subunit H